VSISRKRKEELVDEYRELVEASRGLILSGYRGLTVHAAEDLRARVREVDGEFHVVKNSLIKLALEAAGVPLPESSLEGTTAVGFARSDIPAVAKAIVDLAKAGDVLTIKGGIVEGKLYAAPDIIRLAELPPLPIVQAKLLGLLQAPSGRVVNALAGSLRQVVQVMKAYSESEAAGAAV